MGLDYEVADDVMLYTYWARGFKSGGFTGRIGIPQEIATLIPKEVATNHKVIPVSRLENKLFLAMADPLNVLALDDVKRITKLEVQPMIASEKSILDKLNNLETGRASMQDIIQEADKQAELDAEAVGAGSVRPEVGGRLARNRESEGRQHRVAVCACRRLCL